MTEVIRFCARCGRSLARQDRFCGACGTASAEAVDAALAHARAERAAFQRSAVATVTLFAGVLVMVIAVATLGPDHELWSSVALLAAEVAVGVSALALLGWRSWRASIGRWPAPEHFVLVVPVAAVTLAVAFAYTILLARMVDASELEPETTSRFAMLVLVGVLAPLCEEWLCRGLLWIAVRPVTSPGVTLVITAVLFAFLHGLNGMYLFEVPHRFVAGLLFGWLRMRSGSLLPSIAAHALHNMVVVLVGH